MTLAEFKEKLKEFEWDMQNHHRNDIAFEGKYSMRYQSLVADFFGWISRDKKKNNFQPFLQELLNDLESIKSQISEQEYIGLQKRITSAYE
jgi:hypothetical protein